MLKLPSNHTILEKGVYPVIVAGMVDLKILVGYGPSYGVTSESYARLSNPMRIGEFDAYIEAMEPVRSYAAPWRDPYWVRSIELIGPEAAAVLIEAKRILAERGEDRESARAASAAQLEGLAPDRWGNWELVNALGWIVEWNFCQSPAGGPAWGAIPVGLKRRGESPYNGIDRNCPTLKDWLAGGDLQPLLDQVAKQSR